MNCMPVYDSKSRTRRTWNKISSQHFMFFHITDLKRNKQVVQDIDEPLNNPSFHQDPNWVPKAAWNMPSYFCSSAVQSWKVFCVPQQGHRANSLSLSAWACAINNKERVIHSKTLKVEIWTLITWSDALLNGLCRIISCLENKNQSSLSGL